MTTEDTFEGVQWLKKTVMQTVQQVSILNHWLVAWNKLCHLLVSTSLRACLHGRVRPQVGSR